MSIEELAENEVRGALERQAKDEVMKSVRESEDPDSEENSGISATLHVTSLINSS